MNPPSAQWEVQPAPKLFGRPVSTRELLRIVFTSLVITGLFLTLGLAVAWRLYSEAPRAYQATGTFVVDELPFVQTLKQPDAETDRQLVQTLILSIANRDMRNAVAARLGVDEKRIAFGGIDRALTLQGTEPQANVEVTSVRNTRMGSISADSQDPEFAAAVVNAIIDELQLYNIIGGRIQAIQANARFIKAKAESMLQQLVDVSSQRIKLEKEKAEMDNFLKQKMPLSAFPSFSRDATMNNLKTQLILVESEYKFLAATATRGARLEGKAAELQTLQSQLASLANQLAEGLRAEFAIRLTQEQNLQADQKETDQKLDTLSQESTRLAQSFGDPSKMRALAAEKNPEGPAGPANMIVVVDRASPPARPFRPKLVFYILLGGALGGMVGLGLSAVRVMLNNSLSSPTQIETILGIPCLAVLSKSRPLARSRGPGHIQVQTDYPAGLGFLRSHLVAPATKQEFRVVGFSPPSRRQRSTSLVTDLAVLLAQAEKRTLVVDLHFEDPQVAKFLGVEVRGGIEKWLLSDDPVAGYISPSPLLELGVLSAARPDENLADLVSRRPLAAEWLALSGDWDFVLIDAPCILSDWSLTLSLPAGAPLIFTVDYRRTKIEQLAQSISHARGPRWKIDGAVMTRAPRRLSA